MALDGTRALVVLDGEEPPAGTYKVPRTPHFGIPEWTFSNPRRTQKLREIVETVLGLTLWEREANEVLLLHGNSVTDAKQIEVQLFDDRLCQRMLYGRGAYLTTEA